MLIRRARAALRGVGLDHMVLVDIGSADGMEYRWRQAVRAGVVRPYLVDPADDWGNPRKSVAGLPGSTTVPFALGGSDGAVAFYETALPACSSCLEPDMDALAPYPVREWFRVVRVGTVPLRRADGLWAERGWAPPDAIKIDVQGLEIACLDGFGTLLDGVACIEAEARFKPIYKGDPVLDDIRRFLEARGFMLRHLEQQGPFEGECVEVNSFWVRRPERCSPQQAAIVAAWEALNRIPAPERFRSG